MKYIITILSIILWLLTTMAITAVFKSQTVLHIFWCIYTIVWWEMTKSFIYSLSKKWNKGG